MHAINEEITIEVENLSFSYTKNQVTLEDMNFYVKKGEIIAIAGESGCGKSTLCYILKGLIPHHISGKLKGIIKVAGFNVKKTRLARLATKIGMVFQDINAQIFNNTVLEEIQFGLKNLKMDVSLANDALKKLGIEEIAQKIPMNLSAGQKQRVIIASILALQPEVLILDEPSIHLDPKNKKMLRDWLHQLNKETQMTIIIASNDPYLIGELCTDILFIKDHHIKRYSKNHLMERTEGWKWTY